MKTIEIDDLVYDALAQRVVGFQDTPNNVLKRILNITSGEVSLPSKSEADSKFESLQEDPLMQLIVSPRYKNGDGKERYFAVLRYLYEKDTALFGKELESFTRGTRVHFSQDSKNIEKSGSSTKPERLNGTPYYVLTNLSHARKRTILRDVLQIFGYPSAIIGAVLKSIPDLPVLRSGHSIIEEYEALSK